MLIQQNLKNYMALNLVLKKYLKIINQKTNGATENQLFSLKKY